MRRVKGRLKKLKYFMCKMMTFVLQPPEEWVISFIFANSYQLVSH